MKEEEINKRFNQTIENLSDERFWDYVRSWLNEDFVLDIMNNWDIETKQEAIKEINLNF
jgi:hypothetical protein